jgi:GTPase SAR1 family protein
LSSSFFGCLLPGARGAGGTLITFQRALNLGADSTGKTIAANQLISGAKEIVVPMEQNALVAAPPQSRTITAPALPRSNQIEATLFDLISQQQ